MGPCLGNRGKGTATLSLTARGNGMPCLSVHSNTYSPAAANGTQYRSRTAVVQHLTTDPRSPPPSSSVL